MSQNLDTKLNNEINQKLDKKDLKIKTSIINKKVINKQINLYYTYK